MKRLAQICIERPVFATVLILALVVVGLFCYFNLGVDRFPKVDFPMVTVTTRLVGAAPEEMETEITDKIEEAVNTISGIDQLTSTSAEGVSIVMIQFDLEKSADVAAQEVRDKVNAVLAQLPKESDPPIIEKLDADSAPILSVALSGPAPTRDITEFADKTLKRQIESISGVGQARVIGGQLRQINIVADTAKLSALGLTVSDLVHALQAQNVQIPGGQVEQGLRDLTLRTYGRVNKPEEFGDIPIAPRNGYPVKVKDVAVVDDGVAEAETIARVDGKQAVVLQVRKQSGTNTVEVINRVKDRVEQLRGQLPHDWKMVIVRDQSDYITAAVDAVKEHLVLGSLFAALIVLLFLKKFRLTVISAVAIPASLIASFAAMEYFHFTLNVITLLALALVVGIVIDDAVVVLENIYRLLEEKRLTPREAALQGTSEIALAVLATTLSLIAVFLPVAFMGGIVGRFMNSFGITMACAIAVSLLVSFTLTPMMSSRWLKALPPKEVDPEAPPEAEGLHLAGDPDAASRRGIYGYVERAYLGLLDWSMAHRWVIVLLIVVVFISTVPLGKIVNKNFLPQDDESQFEVQVRAPEGASLETTEKIASSVAARIRQVPGVERTLLTIGDDQQRTKNLGVIYVALQPVKKRKLDQFQIMDKIRQDVLPQYAALGLRNNLAPVNVFGGGINAEIMFWVGGPDLDQLTKYSQTLMAKLKSMPGVADPDTNLIVGKPELGVRVDRAKTGDLGVNVNDIASTLNVLVGGQEVTSYMEGGEQYEVHVRADVKDRRDRQGIEQAEVPSLRSGKIAMRDIVHFTDGTGPSLVNRIARRRQVLIYANMQPGYSSQTVIDTLTKTAQDLHMPAAYSYGLTGRSREQGKAAVNFMLAFLLSIVFMYLILAAQFESWLHPVTILLALPMTIPFALFSLVVLNQSLNIFSALGILVLFGIVKKNSILQIDHTLALRRAGLPRAAAIRQANRDRLRPILMTTLAFVAGMVPLVVSSGTGAATNRAIGSVIMGGQTLALLLTLIGTPVAYSLFDDIVEWEPFAKLAGLFGRRQPKREEEPAAV
ncbi:MAG TPA: efflux RND transporter permease subunit [Thermoanaerobaculia bacterium]|jgi:HAE1 family hydrophobic/amphiphilic exporter-1|nr:efflux RND transporter permease subunit [Thermoanaerobaculia bacterium]